MKTLILIFTVMTGLLFGNANTDWVDKQIDAIKPPRVGTSNATIGNVKNPMLFTYKASTETNGSPTTSGTADTQAKTSPLKLSAVLNKHALINGAWYQKDDKIRGYKVSKIASDSVLLTSGTTKKMLFVAEENPNIKIKIK